MPTEDEKRAAAAILKRIETNAHDLSANDIKRLTEAYLMLSAEKPVTIAELLATDPRDTV